MLHELIIYILSFELSRLKQRLPVPTVVVATFTNRCPWRHFDMHVVTANNRLMLLALSVMYDFPFFFVLRMYSKAPVRENFSDAHQPFFHGSRLDRMVLKS